MAINIITRILRALRRKTKQKRAYTHKPLRDSSSIEAGRFFVERCNCAFRRAEQINKLNSAAGLKTPSLQQKTHSLQKINSSSAILAFEDEQLLFRRRNAVFELSEDERVGLSLVLKSYIQSCRLIELGML